MPLLPSIFDKQDPFNAWMRFAAPIAVLILIPIVILLQQFSSSLEGETTTSVSPEVASSEEAHDPGVGNLATTSKFMVKRVYSHLADADPSGRAPARPFGDPQHPGTPPNHPYLLPDSAHKDLAILDEIAQSRTDRFRVAIVAGEFEGPQAAHDRLDTLRQEVNPEGDLAKDIGWLSPWYAAAAKGKIEPLPPEVQESLTSRHGWFAQLAISHQRSASDPVRWSVVHGTPALMAFAGVTGLWRGLGFLGGLILAITTLVKIRGFEPAMVETTIERSLYLEMFALFLLGFVILDAVAIFVIGESGAWAFVIKELII